MHVVEASTSREIKEANECLGRGKKISEDEKKRAVDEVEEITHSETEKSKNCRLRRKKKCSKRSHTVLIRWTACIGILTRTLPTEFEFRS